MINPSETLVDRDTVSAYVDNFLRARDEDGSFVFVEFGHNENPTAFIQPVPFTGGRAAIGVETWFRDQHGTVQGIIQKKRDADPLDQNIFFIDHDLGGSLTFEKLGAVCIYEGNYDTETILPDEAAEEAFASNVFGDEHQSEYEDRTAKLLAEMSRVVVPGGHVVIRETIRPLSATSLNDELYDQTGLKLEAVVTPDDSDAWDKLQSRYDAEKAHRGISDDSFYLLLSKQ